MENFFQLVLLVAGFFLVLYAAHFTAKWFGLKSNRIVEGQNIKLIERTVISPDATISIVKLKDQVYVIGHTKTNIYLIDKILASDLAIMEKSSENISFAAVLSAIKSFRPSKERQEPNE